jgi:cardiolipin synthase
MSIDGISIKGAQLKEEITSRIKALVSNDKDEKEQPKIESDSLKSSVKKSKGFPANIFSSDNKEAPKAVNPSNVKIGKAVVKTEKTDKEQFEKLYKDIGNSFIDRFTGKEAENAIKIMSDDKLMAVATDQQKVKLIRIVSYEMDDAKKEDPELFKKIVKSIDNVVDDFQARGRMHKLTEYMFLEMSNTGMVVSSTDDWAARKIAGHDRILTATTPAQKATLIAGLKFGITENREEQAINKILKNSVEHGQFKEVLGQWSNNFDMTSASLDALYSNISGERKEKFLDIINSGMQKEKITPEVLNDLYGAEKTLSDLEKLGKARDLEKKGNYSESASLHNKLENYTKARRLLETSGNKNYQEGNYLAVAKDYITWTKSSVIGALDYTKSSIGKLEGLKLTKTLTTYIGDRTNDVLSKYPTLQSKNVIALKEQREIQLQKLSKIKPQVLTEEQKKIDSAKFEAKIDKLTGTKAHGNNDVKLILDGEEGYNRLKTRIENSKESIYMEAFLYHDDKVGNEFADLLIKKAKQGLDVRVVIDAFSNTKDIKVFNKMKKGGVKIIKNKGTYDNMIESRGMSAYHRKLYIFDKKVALTGGMNIGDEYLTKGKWHDSLVEVQGPIMSDTLNDFYKHWSYSSGDKLEKAPPPSAFNNVKNNDMPMDLSGKKVRLITTDFANKDKDIKTWMVEAIKNAKERIFIQDPYFNDPEIIGALKGAINKGVKVEVILPGANDVSIMKHLGDNVLDELYAAGADMYSYITNGREEFNHLKATLIDDMVSIGSANKDVRAMNTNQEINYVITDKEFADIFKNNVWIKDKAKSEFAQPEPENFAKRLIKLGLKQMPSMF